MPRANASAENSTCALAAELLSVASGAKSAQNFRNLALDALCATLVDARIAWVHQSNQRWEVAGSAGALSQLPIDLAATAVDQMSVLLANHWLAVPISGGGETAEVLLLNPGNVVSDSDARSLAQMLHAGLQVATERTSLGQRVEQMQLLMELAVAWQRTPGLSDLLTSMAVAAARVLRGDRASIFLWDRAKSQLVGHPALGVEGEPLRIRDDQGVAGEVLRSSRSRRWDSSEDPQAINSRVGEKLGYATRSLVAAPLIDAHGKVMGVFEVLNHRDGRFSEIDEVFLNELARHASAALENTQRIDALIQTRNRLIQSASSTLRLIGDCPPIVALRDTIARVAPTDLAVLLLGENGTGKEVVARSLHLQSKRSDQPFVAVNCAAIAETLLESELFGHEKGAFTDAISDRAGKFELASGGTLLLDEIGEMSLAGQAKLLRVLEDKIVVKVGGSNPIQTDVRVIAATNQDLVKLVREKRFREDLYFRLTVVTLNLPPLRERGDDVTLLASYYLEQFGHQIGRPPPTLSEAARSRLLSHNWPGNVRELRNLMERVAYLTVGETIEESDLAFVLSPAASGDVSQIPPNMPLNDATSLFQARYIRQHIESSAGNLAKAADRMGLHRSNLYRKMKQLGIEGDFK
jgi:transcriptional regulator with GAF, ATPase, and Fis domain